MIEFILSPIVSTLCVWCMLQGVLNTHTYIHTKTYIENSDPKKGHFGQVDRQMEETHESKQLLPTEQEEDRCKTSKSPTPTRLTPGSCGGQKVSAGRPASRRDDRGCTYPGWPRTHAPFPAIGQENAFKQSTCTEHPTYPMNTHPELPALSTAALATFFYLFLRIVCSQLDADIQSPHQHSSCRVRVATCRK